MSELPTFDQYAGCVHDSFQLESDANLVLVAELIEAKSLGQAGGRDRQAFSLVFRTRDRRVLPQRLYPMRHDRLGEHVLFLVPIGPDDQGMRYEAIFN